VLKEDHRVICLVGREYGIEAMVCNASFQKLSKHLCVYGDMCFEMQDEPRGIYEHGNDEVQEGMAGDDIWRGM